MTSSNLSPSSSSLFCIVLNSVQFEPLGPSAIGPGHNDTFEFLASLKQMAWQFFGQMAVASEKVL